MVQLAQLLLNFFAYTPKPRYADISFDPLPRYRPAQCNPTSWYSIDRLGWGSWTEENTAHYEVQQVE